MIGKCSFMFFLFSAFRIPEARCKTATMLPSAIQKFGKSMIHLKADGHLALSPLLPLPHLPEQNTPLSLSLPLGLYCHQILNSEFLKEMQINFINAVIWWCYLRLLFCCLSECLCDLSASLCHGTTVIKKLPRAMGGSAQRKRENGMKRSSLHLHFCSESFSKQEIGVKRVMSCDCKRFNVDTKFSPGSNGTPLRQPLLRKWAWTSSI